MALKVGSNVNPGKKKKKDESSITSKNHKEFRASDKGGRSARELANAKTIANETYGTGAAPRVGGKAEKSTTLYTGKGADDSAKKVIKKSKKQMMVRSNASKSAKKSYKKL